jgi:hypothetical protein
MRRVCPYCGENPGPGEDVYGELDRRPAIRERPRPKPGLGRVAFCPQNKPDPKLTRFHGHLNTILVM